MLRLAEELFALLKPFVPSHISFDDLCAFNERLCVAGLPSHPPVPRLCRYTAPKFDLTAVCAPPLPCSTNGGRSEVGLARRRFLSVQLHAAAAAAPGRLLGLLQQEIDRPQR